jgi:hypothetical protein
MLQESKMRVLENFYALDYLFFGKPISEMDMCCPIMKEDYLINKGAFLSVFIEMLKLIDHSPNTLTEKIDEDTLHEMALKSSKDAMKSSKNIMGSDKAKKYIKKELHEAMEKDSEIDASQFISEKVREKAYAIAIDNLFIAKSISESNSYKKLNEMEGEILEDSYTILKESLIESAIQMLDSIQEDEDINDDSNIVLDEGTEALMENLSNYLSN